MEAQLFVNQFPNNMDTRDALMFIALFCVVAVVLLLTLLCLAIFVSGVGIFALCLFALANGFMCGICGYNEPVVSYETVFLLVLVAFLFACLRK